MGHSSKAHKYPTVCQRCMTEFRTFTEFKEHCHKQHPGEKYLYEYKKKERKSCIL
jgi:hypothetical protein